MPRTSAAGARAFTTNLGFTFCGMVEDPTVPSSSRSVTPPISSPISR
jgi:hypothetical protein